VSLRPERLQRVHACRAAGGEEAGRQNHQEQGPRHRGQSDGIARADVVEEGGERAAGGEGARQAERYADRADREGLLQDQAENVGGPGAIRTPTSGIRCCTANDITP